MILFTVTPPAQRVQFILGEDQNDENSHQPHPLFSEMEELTCNEDGETEWKETARYEYSTPKSRFNEQARKTTFVP